MILDTNALSALADGKIAASEKFDPATRSAIPVIVLGEYLFGIAQSRRKREYEIWLEQFISVHRILPIDEVTAWRYADLRRELKQAGSLIPSNDTWIAALSRQYALPILSRDRHFDRVKGLRRVDW